MKRILGIAIASVFLASCASQQPAEQYGETSPRLGVENQVEELGQVHWGRSLEEAKAQSAESGKPILVLFQEVPG